MVNRVLNDRALVLKIATYVLLMAFAFFCRGGGLAPGMVGDHVMADHAVAEKSPCCAVDLPFSDTMHQVVVTTTTVGATLLLFAVLILAWFGADRAIRFSVVADRGNFYWRDLRLRYGSVKLFEPLRQFYNSGRLSPKIW